MNNVERITTQTLKGHSSIPGAMAWMCGLSVLLSILLGWVPVVGPFVGPVVGGYVGGRRAGSAGRGVLAAILPAIVLSALIFVVGAAGSALSHLPVVGTFVAALLAGAIGIMMVVHNVLLFLAALVGGLLRQLEAE